MPEFFELQTPLEWARWYVSQGISVIPVRSDTSKAPLYSGWKKYAETLPTDEQLVKWFSSGVAGIGVPCGAASGNLVVLDFECRDEKPAYSEWIARLPDDLREYAEQLPTVVTPSGGRHIWVRLESPHPGTKLAKYANKHVKIEIRNVGHQVLAPGCPANCHKTGQLYRWHTLPVFQIVPLDKWYAFYHYAVACCEYRPPEDHPPSSRSVGSPAGKESPGTDFNFRGTWAETGLFDHGWTWAHQADGDRGYITRPGKKSGVSASVGMVTSRQQGIPYLWVWSTSTDFEAEKPLSKFFVYTKLRHNGDYTAAARELAKNGYGEQRQSGDTGGINLDDFFGRKEEAKKPESKLNYRSILQLCQQNPQLREPIIQGLLRSGETMNVIAAPKSHKSWLILDLAICVSSGKRWLNRFETKAGKVLIIDNELHPETLAHRIPPVADKLGTSPEMIGDRITVVNLRGSLVDLRRLAEDLIDIEPGTYSMIVLDAFYRFMPSKVDENSNAEMAALYNLIDSLALRIGCAFVLVHHTSKGAQSGKSVTDVGAGAGSQSRAADTHLVLRPHDDPGCMVLDAATRSWPPLESVVVRWEYPVWSLDQQLDPADLLQDPAAAKPKTDEKFRKSILDKLNEDPRGGGMWRLNSFVRGIANDTKKSTKKVTDTINQMRRDGILKLIEGPWTDIRPRDNVAIILVAEGEEPDSCGDLG